MQSVAGGERFFALDSDGFVPEIGQAEATSDDACTGTLIDQLTLQAGGTQQPLGWENVVQATLRAKLQIVTTTPRYGVEADWFGSAAARRVRRTVLVGARYDMLHRAHLHAACRADDPSFEMRVLPITHEALCLALSSRALGLADWTAVWRDEPPSTPRARL